MAKFTLGVENGIIQKINVSVKDSLTYRTRSFCYSERLVNPWSRFLELVQNNHIELSERRRILSGMTSGPIYSKDMKIPKEKTEKRRVRRKLWRHSCWRWVPFWKFGFLSVVQLSNVISSILPISILVNSRNKKTIYLIFVYLVALVSRLESSLSVLSAAK